MNTTENLAALAKDTSQKPDFSRLKLPWEFDQTLKYWSVNVPVKVNGQIGEWHIWIQLRPYYCDRGRYTVGVEGRRSSGPDNQEGFNRYFFSLQNAMEEMEMWVSVRQEVHSS